LIEIPVKRELVIPRAVARDGALVPPQGLDQVLTTFGDIYKYLLTDGSVSAKWEVDQIGSAILPFPIPIDWDPSKSATKIRCHRKVVPVVQSVFAAAQSQGLQGAVKSYGGAYNFRPKRSSSKLSTHCWGIAIDLNPRTNAMGTAGDMDPRLVDLFRSFGFKWGGDWTGRGKDPMHFQFCTGY
jgi:hypothetical protein